MGRVGEIVRSPVSEARPGPPARHKHMLAIYFLYYNFCRTHQAIRVTSAMETELSDHV